MRRTMMMVLLMTASRGPTPRVAPRASLPLRLLRALCRPPRGPPPLPLLLPCSGRLTGALWARSRQCSSFFFVCVLRFLTNFFCRS